MTDQILTEEELKEIESTYGRFNPTLLRTISSIRSLNSRNAKLVHENDELMAENEMRKKYESFLLSVIRCKGNLEPEEDFEWFKRNITIIIGGT